MYGVNCVLGIMEIQNAFIFACIVRNMEMKSQETARSKFAAFKLCKLVPMLLQINGFKVNDI